MKIKKKQLLKTINSLQDEVQQLKEVNEEQFDTITKMVLDSITKQVGEAHEDISSDIDENVCEITRLIKHIDTSFEGIEERINELNDRWITEQ